MRATDSRSTAAPAAVLIAVLAAACGDDGSSPVDARDVDADDWMPTGTALSHTLFIQTEGASLTPGFEDATMGTTSLVTGPSTLRGWRVSDAEAARQARFTELVTDLDSILSPYDVRVVTTRPAMGPYSMMVITDDDSGRLAGVPNGLLAAAPGECNRFPSVVTVAFPRSIAGRPEQEQRHAIAHVAIAMFGHLGGVPYSTDPQDCMCFAAPACNVPPTGPCRIGGPGTPIDGTARCGVAGPTMDEAALFLAAFGPR